MQETTIKLARQLNKDTMPPLAIVNEDAAASMEEEARDEWLERLEGELEEATS